MITVSVMTKIAPYMSPARWLLINTGLIRYMHPSDEELKQIAIVPLQQKKGKRHHEKNGNAANDGTFHVPKQNNIQLETTKITLTDVVQLRFYAEFQWILDFAFFALIVYFSTEVKFLPISSFDLFDIDFDALSGLCSLFAQQICTRGQLKHDLVYFGRWICL